MMKSQTKIRMAQIGFVSIIVGFIGWKVLSNRQVAPTLPTSVDLEDIRPTQGNTESVQTKEPITQLNKLESSPDSNAGTAADSSSLVAKNTDTNKITATEEKNSAKKVVLRLPEEMTLTKSQRDLLNSTHIKDFNATLPKVRTYGNELPPEVSRLEGSFQGVLESLRPNKKPIRFGVVIQKSKTVTGAKINLTASFQTAGEPEQTLTNSTTVGYLEQEEGPSPIILNVAKDRFIQLYYDVQLDTWFGTFYYVMEDGTSNAFGTRLKRM